ncbi:thermonuclease family protein [Jannaschia marina]|uniref:thermonuclease family protein n=1 Tax=Jannaschia marina TaxID=2741674 RepID=UPI0015C8827F|nr:thermonuclease family protein [Jannaschia marina]
MFRLCSPLLLLASPLSAEVLEGPIRVVDADTFDVGAPVNVRLIGIDAAEGAQTCRDGGGAELPCGMMATEAVRALYEGTRARCEVQEYDAYDRALAVCFVEGADVNAEIVRQGYARIYRDDPTYFEAQKEAVLFSRGLWAYEMQDPAEWRAAQRRQRAADFAPTGRCEIKGNISDNGRIYHLPGSRDYASTRISERKGERWFCSEGEARAAGWRPARS